MKTPHITLLITLLIAVLASHQNAAKTSGREQVEIFQCGSLGEVILTSSTEFSDLVPLYTPKAHLSIQGNGVIVAGVIHNFMGGNDRTFTNSPSDNFRMPGETSENNPITMSLLSGYIYGKRRDQITIYTLDEAKTCIRRQEI